MGRTYEVADVKKGIFTAVDKSPWLLEPGEWQESKNIIFTAEGIRPAYNLKHVFDIPLVDDQQYPVRYITDWLDTIIVITSKKIYACYSVGGELTEARFKYEEDGGATNYTFTVYATAIDPGTMVFEYTINGQPYTAIDDGEGIILGEKIMSGTVNYSNNQVNLVFQEKTDSNSKVNCIYYFTFSEDLEDWAEIDTPNEVVLVNGYHKPFKWDGTYLTVIKDAPAGAAAVTVYHSHMILGGFYYAPNKIQWSDFDDIETWDGTTSGYGYLDSGGDDFQTFSVINGIMFAFYSRGVYRINYLGAPYYFSTDTILKGIGLISRGAIAEFGDSIIGWFSDGVYEFDGFNIKPQKVGLLYEAYRNLNRNYLYKITGIFDEYTCMVYFFYPTGGSADCNSCIVYDYWNDKWTLLDYGTVTACGFWYESSDPVIDSVDDIFDDADYLFDSGLWARLFPTVLLATNDAIYQIDYFSCKDGYIISGYCPLEEQKIPHKLKTMFELGLKGRGICKAQIGIVDELNAPIEWQPAQEYNLATLQNLELDYSAKYFVVKLFNENNQYFLLNAWYAEYEELGEED